MRVQDSGNSALHYASFGGHAPVVGALLRAGNIQIHFISTRTNTRPYGPNIINGSSLFRWQGKAILARRHGLRGPTKNYSIREISERVNSPLGSIPPDLPKSHSTAVRTPQRKARNTTVSELVTCALRAPAPPRSAPNNMVVCIKCVSQCTLVSQSLSYMCTKSSSAPVLRT